MPVSALDVAAYILEERGPLDAMKLQKLVYYCQAWSLVWTQNPLFREPIEAWRDGPVVPVLFAAHRRCFLVSEIQEGQSSRLSDVQRDVVDSVLGYYGDRSADWLSDRTHSEEPWRNARKGILPWQSCKHTISHDAMHEYYSKVKQM